ncbi:hypothetical protein [Bdellovibrio sp. NC01]|uniref:hypothetical protein n=1 Tax=Bdellovibrio sp. NC01 TaxID=2220073 RepID=UPI00115915F2|nr:hypothetical protein [Bdellovibrio sp. NC01]QDK38688.1 hypothetical protein DOE51_14385 [Bdellovibrio sp. NC01]
MKTSKIFIAILASLSINSLLACAPAGSSSLTTTNTDQSVPRTPATDATAETDGAATAPPTTTGFRLDQEVSKFKTRYDLNDPYTKLTDNKGKGVEELWGTRNMRVVLHGVMYRGGANNKYLATPRSNTNPLPTIGLTNLCKEDFSAAIYLYSENFSTAPKSVSCKNTSHQDQTLVYKQYAAAGENEKILAMVYDRIKGKLSGPVYAHCWNGWHSSGLISGMALKQFCGWSDAKADAYWVKNTDGNSSGFDSIRSKLKAFKPLAKYKITAEEAALICPN